MKKETLYLIRNIRLGSILVLWVGLLFKVYLLFLVGVFVWIMTYLYTLSKMEEKLFNEQEEEKEEDSTEAD